MRVEWCKAYVRMRRWHEDTVLTEEDMRRTIEYSFWEAEEWLQRREERTAVTPELAEGLKAYVTEQADREARTAELLRNQWARVRERGRAFLAGETRPNETIIIPEDVDEEEDEDEEDEEVLD